MKLLKIAPALAVAFAACGGGDAPDSGAGAPAATPAAQPAPAAASVPAAPTGALTVPDWYTVDNTARTVRVALVAGQTPDNNYWNYNGHIRGSLSISVPVGYTVEIELTNRDPNMAHSVGVSAMPANFALPPAPVPAFEGAITQNPTSMVDGVMPGETESIRFVASTAGEYALLCYVPGHTAVGMWLYFEVSESGEAGVRGL